MTHQAVARDMLAVLCGVQGLAAAAVDFNCNHMRNSAWTGHARFHVVWQATAFVALAVFEIVLLFAAGPLARQRFYMAAALAGIPMLSFFVAFFGRALYGGLLMDAHGVPPISVRLFGADKIIDLNVAAEVAALLILVAAVLLFRRQSSLY